MITQNFYKLLQLQNEACSIQELHTAQVNHVDPEHLMVQNVGF